MRKGALVAAVIISLVLLSSVALAWKIEKVTFEKPPFMKSSTKDLKGYYNPALGDLEITIKSDFGTRKPCSEMCAGINEGGCDEFGSLLTYSCEPFAEKVTLVTHVDSPIKKPGRYCVRISSCVVVRKEFDISISNTVYPADKSHEGRSCGGEKIRCRYPKGEPLKPIEPLKPGETEEPGAPEMISVCVDKGDGWGVCEDWNWGAPVISDVEVKDVTANGAVVSFKTDIPSTAEVVWQEKPIADPYADSDEFEGSAVSTELATEHTLEITDLNPRWTYHYVVRASGDPFLITGKDGIIGYGKTDVGVSEVNKFTTTRRPDTIPPKITEVGAVARKFDATITWKTDEWATTVVRYKTIGASGKRSKEDEMDQYHDIKLTGLKPGHEYEFTVTSTDASGNPAHETGTFDTSADDEKPQYITTPIQPAAQIKYSKTLEWRQIWEDDVEVDRATLYFCHGVTGECDKRTAYYKWFDGQLVRRFFALGPEGDQVEFLWSISWSELNVKEGEEAVWYVEVCDSASAYGAVKDHCTKTGKVRSQVVDSEPPRYRLEADWATLYESGETTTFRIRDINDVGGLWKAWFAAGEVIEGEELPVIDEEYLDGMTHVDLLVFSYTVPKSLEGKLSALEFSVQDAAGNVRKDSVFFTPDDKTPPTISRMTGAGSRVNALDSVVITVTAKDNAELSEAILYVYVEGKMFAPRKVDTKPLEGKEDTAVFTYKTHRGQVGKDIPYYVVVRDRAGLKTESSERTFKVIAAACADTIKPTILGEPSQSNNSAGPKEKIILKAKFMDEVDEKGCGGLARANLEVAGEDMKFRFAGFFYFAGRAVTSYKHGKPYTSTATFEYQVPDVSGPIRIVSLIPPGFRGIGLPGEGFGPAGMAVAKASVFDGLIDFLKQLVGGTGLATQAPEETPPVPAPIGTHGESIYWRIVAYDEEGNSVTTSPMSFFVPDEEAPILVDSYGFWELPAENITVTTDTPVVMTVDTETISMVLESVGTDRTGAPTAMLLVNGTGKRVVENEVIEVDYMGLMVAEMKEGATDAVILQRLEPLERMRQDEPFIVTSCWKDYGTLTQAILRPKEVRVPMSKFAGAKECVVIETAPISEPGTTISWFVRAEDAAAIPINFAESEPVNFTIHSKSPELVDKNWTPENPVRGQPVEITVKLRDDNGLESVRIESDESGEFVTAGEVEVSGLENETALIWRNPDVLAGTTVNWRIVAADIDGNEAVLDPAFTVQNDTTPPSYSEVSADTEVEVGDILYIYARWEDEGTVDTVYLETDETGEWRIKDAKTIGTSPITVMFEWSNPDLPADTVVKWRMRAKDPSGNEAVTSEYSFTIKAMTIAAPKEKECDPALKPEDIIGECFEVGPGVGQQEVTTYKCDTITGEWKAETRYESCEVLKPPPRPAIDLTLVGVAVVVVILIGLGVLFKQGKLPVQKKAVPPVSKLTRRRK